MFSAKRITNKLKTKIEEGSSYSILFSKALEKDSSNIMQYKK